MTQPPSEEHSSPPNDRTQRIAAFAVGAYMLATFFGLTETQNGLSIYFVNGFTNSSPGELRFWLAQAFLLTPGACFLGYAIAPWLGPRLLALWDRVAHSTPRERWLGLCLIGLIAILYARVGRLAFFLDFPFTDDENSTRVGGQIMALGHLAMPIPQPFEAFPHRFLYMHNQVMTSFDWPGILAFWAITEWLPLGSWPFAIFSAGAVVCLAAWMGKREGPAWGLLAAFFFLCSPMMSLLSMTTHSHLLSRTTLAGTLLLYLIASERNKVAFWALTGLCFGISCLFRMPESIALMGPLVLYQFTRPFASTRSWTSTLGLVLGGLLPLMALLAYNYALTGAPWVFPRFDTSGVIYFQKDWTLWNRFGANVGHNFLMLNIWFLGPLGLFLVMLGIFRNQMTRWLTLGVLCHLSLGLLHDDKGIHAIGPVHYSESALYLTILAVYGCMAWRESWFQERKKLEWAVSSLVCAFVLGLGIFTVWHGLALQRQAGIQQEIFGFLRASTKQPAVVLAPHYYQVWQHIPRFRRTGSWIFSWPPVRPDARERVLVIHDIPGALAAMRKKFPKRRFYRLKLKSWPTYLSLEPIHSSASRPTSQRPQKR